MIRRLVLMTFTAIIGLVFYYISRFWDFRWWDRDGIFGIEAIRPQGGLLARWLRGTDFAPFELLIWVLALFLALSVLQKIFDWIWPLAPEGDDHHDH